MLFGSVSSVHFAFNMVATLGIWFDTLLRNPSTNCVNYYGY